jgi:hypothetical protein
MRKAGGIVALIAGIFAVLATLGSAYAQMFVFPAAIEGYTGDPLGIAIGGLFISAIVIVLAAIILGTRNPWPGLILIVFSITGIAGNWGGGFVAICLALAVIGGILTLFERKPATI